MSGRPDIPPCACCGERCGSQTEFQEGEGCLKPGQYWNVCSGCDEDAGWLFGQVMEADGTRAEASS